MTKRTYPILLTFLFSVSFFLSLNSPPGAKYAFAADNIFTDNVGIGTTAPTSKFQTISDTDSQGIQVLHSNLTQGVNIGWGGISKIGSGTNIDMQIDAKGTGGLWLQTVATGNVGIGGAPGTAKLYISGNVGIGTTGPGAKLDVAGNVKISTKGFQTGSTVKTAGSSTKRIGYSGSGSSQNVTLLTGSADGGYVVSGLLACRRDSVNGGIYPFIAGYNYSTGYGATVGSPIAGSTGTAPVVAWVSNVLQLQLSDYHYCGVDVTLTIYQEPTTLSFGDILGG